MDKNRITEQEALELHAGGRPGKFEIQATKPLTTQRDLSLAYSPGVAVPCLRIRDDESKAYDHTAKGNIVAILSNGTPVPAPADTCTHTAQPCMSGMEGMFHALAHLHAPT